jgi:hypothetical protein
LIVKTEPAPGGAPLYRYIRFAAEFGHGNWNFLAEAHGMVHMVSRPGSGNMVGLDFLQAIVTAHKGFQQTMK